MGAGNGGQGERRGEERSGETKRWMKIEGKRGARIMTGFPNEKAGQGQCEGKGELGKITA